MPGADFETAYKEVTNLKTEPTNDEKLEIYAFSKIAKGEEVKPAGTFDFAGKAKFRQWEKYTKEGLTPEEAEKKYIEKVKALKEKYGTK